MDIEKLHREFVWLNSDIGYNHPMAWGFDTVTNNSNTKIGAYYYMDKIAGNTLAEHYVNETLDVDVFNTVMCMISNLLNDNRKITSSRILSTKSPDSRVYNDLFFDDIDDYEKYIDKARELYIPKTIRRLNEIGVNLNSSYIINGHRLPRLIDVILDCDVPVFEGDICIVHGDLCFSNIILSDVVPLCENSLYYIDPRGTDPQIGAYGDYKYDVGKLAHSVIGLYDLIKADKISAGVNLNNNEFVLEYELSEYKRWIIEVFYSLFEKNAVWYQIMVNLFLSMIPLHSDKPDHQSTMFAMALKLYDDMIKMF